MHVQKITTPAGEEMVLVSAADFEDLVDARDAAVAMAEIRAGLVETLSSDEMLDYVKAVTPLAFWRKKRGMTQAQLAKSVGKSQAYLAQIEGGKRTGDVDVLARIAATLRIRIEDLLAD
jgi:Helix-turn-helix.